MFCEKRDMYFDTYLNLIFVKKRYVFHALGTLFRMESNSYMTQFKTIFVVNFTSCFITITGID